MIRRARVLASTMGWLGLAVALLGCSDDGGHTRPVLSPSGGFMDVAPTPIPASPPPDPINTPPSADQPPKSPPSGSSPPEPPPPALDPETVDTSDLPDPEQLPQRAPYAHALARFLWLRDAAPAWLSALELQGQLRGATQDQAVQYMLAHEDFDRGIAAFFASWAEFRRSADLGPLESYPDLDVDEFALQAKLELQNYAIDLVRQSRPLHELYFGEPYALEQPYLQELFTDEPRLRQGLLQQPFLQAAATAQGNATIQRGYFVARRAWCITMQPPPPEAGHPDALEVAEAQTPREALDALQENAVCTGCHSVLDGSGVPFDQFDALGRVLELGYPDTMGRLHTGEEVADSYELGARISTAPEAQKCFAANLLTFALGRALNDETDRGSWNDLLALSTRDAPISELFRQVAISESFSRCTRTHLELGLCLTVK